MMWANINKVLEAFNGTPWDGNKKLAAKMATYIASATIRCGEDLFTFSRDGTEYAAVHGTLQVGLRGEAVLLFSALRPDRNRADIIIETAVLVKPKGKNQELTISLTVAHFIAAWQNAVYNSTANADNGELHFAACKAYAYLSGLTGLLWVSLQACTAPPQKASAATACILGNMKMMLRNPEFAVATAVNNCALEMHDILGPGCGILLSR